MSEENLKFYEPDEYQLLKFKDINKVDDETHFNKCAVWNDCSICPIAIHQHLISTTKHTCVYGMTEEEFLTRMSDADCSF